MIFNYAELNEENICKCVSQLSGKVDKDNMIEIPTYDTSLLGKKYENGEWVEVEPSKPVEPEPTEEEIVQAEILLNQAKILAKLNALEV